MGTWSILLIIINVEEVKTWSQALQAPLPSCRCHTPVLPVRPWWNQLLQYQLMPNHRELAQGPEPPPSWPSRGGAVHLGSLALECSQ